MATNYTFSQPIRYYKANDPYYYEVDNIPLRQLEENILYIKDVIEGGGNTAHGGGEGEGGGSALLTTDSEIDITKIKQLRPKSTNGGPREITVNAGTFTARVNDAFNVADPLAELIRIGPITNTTVVPKLGSSLGNENINTILGGFNVPGYSSNKAFNINGLEFAYTFYNSPGSLGAGWGVTTSPNTATGEGSENYPKYGSIGAPAEYRWPGYSNFGPVANTSTLQNPGHASVFQMRFEELPAIHLEFVKMWRGVFRTAVVDFPQSTINVDPWSDDDYYVWENNSVTQIPADQRIDLLVAYTLPIDASSATLQDYETNFCNTGAGATPNTITTPVLGIIKGAGVGINMDSEGQSSNVLVETAEGCSQPGRPGSARMLGNVNDSAIPSNMGITDDAGVKIHGSFPSPDDLLNLAPLLALDVAPDDLQLVGQSVLPLAYIVVSKNSAVVTQNDIIDIRPFLRTTELTYNERAGVAGANPPLSLANPAVGAFQLQEIVNNLETTTAGLGTASNDGKALYTDYVMGGLAYGVEGTMLSMCDGAQAAKDPFGSDTTNTIYTDASGGTHDFAGFGSSKDFLDTNDTVLREAFLQYVYTQRQGDCKRWLVDPNASYDSNTRTYLGLPAGNTGRNIPLFPEWDMPMDGTNYQNLMIGAAGVQIPKVTWWMWFEGAQRDRALAYVPGGVASPNGAGSGGSYLDKNYQFGSGDDEVDAFVNVVSKRIEITLPNWCNDYDVLVEYVNCGPITSFDAHEDKAIGLGGGLYVNKGPVVNSASNIKKAIFQINSVADNLGADEGEGHRSMVFNGRIQDKSNDPDQSPPSEANSLYQFLSYSVALPQFRSTKWGTKRQDGTQNNTQRFVPKFGAAYYPTIKFTIIGYNSNPVLRNSAYNSSNNYTLLQNVSQGAADDILRPIGPLMADPGTGVNVNSRIDISSTNTAT